MIKNRVSFKLDLNDDLERDIYNNVQKMNRDKRNYYLVEFFRKYYFKEPEENELKKEVETLKLNLNNRIDKLLKIIENLSIKNSSNPTIEKDLIVEKDETTSFMNTDLIESVNFNIGEVPIKKQESIEDKLKASYDKNCKNL